MDNNESGKMPIQLEISFEKLTVLFESGLICAAEVRCLTAHSKQQVSKLCLSVCAKRIGCNITLIDDFESVQPLHLKKSV
ncbi:MAG: hypothetical protein V7782_06105 [Psychromonas sp.]